MQLMTLSRLALAITLALSVTGCEIIRVNETADKNKVKAKDAQGLVESLKNEKAKQRPLVTFTDKQWVSKTPLDLNGSIPPLKDCPVVFNLPMDLLAFGSWVSKSCDFKVYITPDALDGGAAAIAENTSGGNQRATSQPTIQPVDGLQGLFPQTSRGGSNTSAAQYGRPYVDVQYEGRLSGLLDTVTTRLGLSWRYDPRTRQITVYYLDTRQFDLSAFDFKINMNSTITSGISSTTGVSDGISGQSSQSGGSGSGTNSSGSSQNASTDLKDGSIISDVESNIKALLSPAGHMALARSTGTVTVTDRGDVLERVSEYLAGENRKLTTNILLNVEVVSVTLSDKDQFAINMDAIYKSASATFGLSNSFPGIDTGASSATVGILDSASSPWAGSSAVIQALSQQGTVSGYRAPSVRTLNLHPAPIQVGQFQSYVQSSSTSQTANVGSTSSMNPGSITSGFYMTLLPKIIGGDSGELLLKITANLSSDPTFTTKESPDGSSIMDLPKYNLQNIDQLVKLRSGQTLILTGYDQGADTTNKQGTGSASNVLFGGGAARSSSRDVLVFIITPIISE